MKHFFQADFHFGHGNIIKFTGRTQFLSAEESALFDAIPKRWCGKGYLKEDVAHIKISQESVQRMDAALVANWNLAVSKEDIGYVLGDFAFKNPIEFIEHMNFKELHILYGDHDEPLKKQRKEIERRFPNVFFDGHYAELTIHVNHQPQLIVMCHWPFRSWKKSHYGSWSLFGHHHGSLPDDPNLLSMDVGVDCNVFFPFSVEQIAERMVKKTFVPIQNKGREEKYEP